VNRKCGNVADWYCGSLFLKANLQWYNYIEKAYVHVVFAGMQL